MIESSNNDIKKKDPHQPILVGVNGVENRKENNQYSTFNHELIIWYHMLDDMSTFC